ncbi:hypothetical protein B0H14DRAFT_2628489 [Mycena olivaceomarginata]|nr:hypothetical protein B0H14DRAFT_2628489 [Mycena olivaceomarginata]
MPLAHGTSTPLSTQSPTSLRDKGLTSFPDKNSTHGTGDGSPAIYISAEHVQNRANQARGHAEVYSCSRAEKAVDALPIKRKKDGEGSASACDADSSSRVDLASPNASSARPCVPCVCEAPFIHANRPLGATSVDKDRTCSLSAPHSADDEDIHSMESVDETCGPQASSGRTSRPSLLALAIPISPTSLEEELFQASPLFSPIERDARPPTGETTGDSKFEHLFSESAFSASRVRRTELPVKLKRGARAQRVARGTDTFDLSSPPSKRVLLDASIQTNEDVEVEYLRRRVKALERELRSLRATVRRSEDRVREAEPKSFWKKLASTDRLVPSPEPLRFGLLKDVSRNLSSIGQGSFGASTSS